LFTSPESWQKKAQKQRMKASKAQATSDVFARRQRRGLERKLSRVQRKAARYGGTEKFGQSPKKKISGKSAAQIVASELESRHNLKEQNINRLLKKFGKGRSLGGGHPSPWHGEPLLKNPSAL
ncbi:MAG: hypothetical protein DRQ47_11355, partial [Gammaproteobacteria bacterium]